MLFLPLQGRGDETPWEILDNPFKPTMQDILVIPFQVLCSTESIASSS